MNIGSGRIGTGVWGSGNLLKLAAEETWTVNWLGWTEFFSSAHNWYTETSAS